MESYTAVRNTFSMNTRRSITLIGLIALISGLYAVFQFSGTDHVIYVASLFAGIFVTAIAWFAVRNYGRAQVIRAARDIVQSENGPAFLINDRGELLSASKGQTHETLLRRYFAMPNAKILQVQQLAQAKPYSETIHGRDNQLSIFVTKFAAGLFLWRCNEIENETTSQSHQLSLPALTAGPSGTILFMNDPMRAIVGHRVRSLDKLFGTSHLISGRSYSVNTENGPLRSVIAATSIAGGRQEVFLLPGVSNALPPVADWHAIEDLPVPLMKIAKTGEIIAANRESCALLGVEINDHSRLSDVLEGLGRPMIEWLSDVAEGRTANCREFLRGKGHRQDFFVQVSLHATGAGADRHLIAVLNDMTEFKSLEAQFVQSQKMQAIGQLAGGVAHDFNNLLTAISGHCDLLLLRHDQGDQDYGDLIQIHQNANRAGSLVAQLLAFSRKQTLSLEVLELSDVLSDLTHLMNRLVGERIRLVFSQEPDLHKIRADKRQLEQVIINLVVNARDAMPTGGEIRIESANINLTETIHRDRAVLPAGDYTMIKVIDEGFGIPEEKLGKIFEPFYTTKRAGEGTGLGLSTAYGIVKQTGGFIFADSELDVGSVFTLYFPSFDPVEDEVQVVPKVIEKAPLLSREGVVLLVEDEAPVRSFASRALRLKGLTVLEADCGETALTMLADPDLHIDIFVTDVIMPGLDGPTWVKEALQARPDAKVVFVSGYAEDAFGENRALIPNSAFLPKPFSLGDLTDTVLEQMGRSAA